MEMMSIFTTTYVYSGYSTKTNENVQKRIHIRIDKCCDK